CQTLAYIYGLSNSGFEVKYDCDRPEDAFLSFMDFSDLSTIKQLGILLYSSVFFSLWSIALDFKFHCTSLTFAILDVPTRNCILLVYFHRGKLLRPLNLITLL
ncbi:hypothetical protein BRADI_5g21326v3, partial [Brachypodium distachyon]